VECAFLESKTCIGRKANLCRLRSSDGQTERGKHSCAVASEEKQVRPANVGCVCLCPKLFEIGPLLSYPVEVAREQVLKAVQVTQRPFPTFNEPKRNHEKASHVRQLPSRHGAVAGGILLPSSNRTRRKRKYVRRHPNRNAMTLCETRA
jgi:hypothetical protein